MMTAIDDYLARLDEALRDVPHGIAAEIRGGIAEALSSLEPDAAELRIRQLGDPAVIAREAMDAAGQAPAPSVPPVVVVEAPVVPTTSTRGFAIIAALMLSFAGYLVPFIGWVAGVVLVLMSTMWHAWEKLVAILAPVAVFGALLLLSLPVYVTGAVEVSEEGGTGVPPEVVNPLMPNLLAGPHLFIILAVAVVIPASGLWLLWRMRGRAVA